MAPRPPGSDGDRPSAVGLVLTDGEGAVDARRHVQGRLRLLALVVGISGLVFYLHAQIVPWATGTWTARQVASPGAVAHLLAVALMGVLAVVLGGRVAGQRALALLDALVLYVAAFACLALYAFDVREGPEHMVSILAIFVIARAVLVPGTARRTVLLSVPIALALLAVDLAAGWAWHNDGDPVATAQAVWALRIWHQLLLAFAVGIAAVASHVTFSLRLRVEAARKAGRYQLQERIGRGSMGEVYRATHAMLRRPTAVKLLRPEVAGVEALARFEREVQLAAGLAHPNTIRIYDYGRTPEGLFYYAMECLDGIDLQRLVEEHGAQPPARVVHVLRQACHALAEAHAHGLVHRDVKPGNLMLCRRGLEHDVLKVLDFGLAKDLHAAGPGETHTGAVCGTPETLAPEILRGEEPGAACDLYALGVVGCWLLTARPIFDARTPIEFLGHHLHSPPVAPSARGVDVPADLEAVLLDLLAKDPARRPPDAGTLEARLAACGAAGDWGEEAARAWWARIPARPRAGP